MAAESARYATQVRPSGMSWNGTACNGMVLEPTHHLTSFDGRRLAAPLLAGASVRTLPRPARRTEEARASRGSTGGATMTMIEP